MCNSIALTTSDKHKLSFLPVREGIERATGVPFRGFARIESFRYWKPRVIRLIEVPVERFGERDDRTGREVVFERKGSIAVLILDGPEGPEARVVTKAAEPPVNKYHSREPFFTK